jgi:hypothetical protein
MEDKLNKISDLILASKDVSAKLLMVLDLFQCGNCSSSDCRKILGTLGEQLAECPAGKRFVIHSLLFFRLCKKLFQITF